MEITIGKIISLLIAIGYVISAVVSDGSFEIPHLFMCGYLLLPLVLIWFPEHVDVIAGQIFGGGFDFDTPPIFATFLGWVFLIGLPVIVYYLQNR
ncbi:MAG: hypothetical protein COA78_20605 [Blastopirellula sp.]|nr:MAG: hypothetical protein COA78_20605 [Blastopirellula sp.]